VTPHTTQFGFSGVCVWSRNTVYVLAIDNEAAERGQQHAFVLKWDGTKWGHYLIGWKCIAICCSRDKQREVFTLGENGFIHIASDKGFRVETIANGDLSVRNRGPATNVSHIGSHVYAVGMHRQVYRRDTDDRWTCLDKDIFDNNPGQPIVGFTSIDGFSEQDIFAVGFGGEIWNYRDTKWGKIDSPTNILLTCVICDRENKMVYAAGLGGVLLHNKGTGWEALQQPQFKEDIWGLATYRGRLYAATLQEIYGLEDGKLNRIDTGLPQQTTYRYLDTRDDVMWSVGDESMAFFDGNAWVAMKL
jgi:hypothetical protein